MHRIEPWVYNKHSILQSKIPQYGGVVAWEDGQSSSQNSSTTVALKIRPLQDEKPTVAGGAPSLLDIIPIPSKWCLVKYRADSEKRVQKSSISRAAFLEQKSSIHHPPRVEKLHPIGTRVVFRGLPTARVMFEPTLTGLVRESCAYRTASRPTLLNCRRLPSSAQ